MKFTNRHKLPEAIVEAIKHNWYSGHKEHRFASVTELLKPTKQFILNKRHYREIVQDASEMIWMLLGSAIHKVLEAAEIDNSISEERLSITVDDAVITGGFDLYKDGIVTDFKFTGVWNYSSDSRKDEWEKQLNLYAYLLRQHGFAVKALQIVAIFRDWQKSKSISNPAYPQQVETISLKLWDDETVLGFLRERISELKSCDELSDDMIPECSPTERWQTDDQYAVYKTGGNRALRLFASREEAETFRNEHKEASQLQIVVRSELPRRCQDFCPVNRFCHYYQNQTPAVMAG